MAARLLEASAAALVACRSRLSATGQINSVYLLGPLAVIACYIGVYLLARDIAGRLQALIATLSLIGIHYYNYSAVKFAHDQMQLPFWALTGLFFYRALARGAPRDWLLAGAMLALALLVEIRGLCARDLTWGCSCCSIRWRGGPGAGRVPT